MVIQKVTEGWKVRSCQTGQCFETKVPGTVYGTWLEHGAMEDPYWRDCEDDALAMMEGEYEYETTLPFCEELMSCRAIRLKFEGIDTLADIYFNGNHLGFADNMHRVWEYPVKSLAAESGGVNTIRVRFHSPLSFIKEAYEKSPYDGSPEAMQGFPLLRKSHCSFGWDWGPRLPDAGLFRAVSLVGVEQAEIRDVWIRQIHREGAVSLSCDIAVESVCDTVCTCELKVTGPKGDTLVSQLQRKNDGFFGGIVIDNPELWWPNGYGSQPLYRVEAVLKANGEIQDIQSRMVGLRTMKVNTGADEYGSRFAHEVNGVEIFAMGADYIPEDCIRGRVNRERTRTLLEHCRDCNFNVIRVWGGGYYPDDFFYDLCDELGLIVWQDFMFACAVYPLTPEFEANVTAEIRDNVRRIRHHACLGLWCGNNEMEMFLADNQWVRKPMQKTEYLIMNERIIPELLRQYDPDTFYWPSSPSSGGDFDSPNDPDRGDVHYWEVWHGGLPFTDYRNYYFRYLSEFGFQSFPAVKTIEQFTAPEDRNIFSYVMEKHQKNAGANGKILQYMSQMYLYPESLELLVYVSQLLQAEAIRYGVEHFRRNRGRCMGCVYWQLNDCWPVASWSSIDYYGRWKALHYFAKRFFAPVLLSCEEEGALSSSMNVNEENRRIRKTARFCVTNETRERITGVIRWSLRDASSRIHQQGQYCVEAEPLSVCSFPQMEFTEADMRRWYLSYELWIDDSRVSHGSSLFVPPKHFEFEDPQLEVWQEGEMVCIRSSAFAKGVELGNKDGDLLLSDNYFDMDAGVERVRVIQGSMEGLSVRSIYSLVHA
ncbi:MAG: glycoside hydrolase family 2 protein [Hungatella hathewayi]|uniref:beta-mannosidase n=1 Tax=Hungatella TaxID=1649459 RepID=UPI001FAE173E|nr:MULTISPECIES: glycoside hydrolase family 2 protein [Hungatella]MCI7384860.1 glycoside hydrolase family 2 protein [Hungatella sp.]MDY6238983.1 glycoside hydrolase family 2 protein [Hungatella hathewayi]